MNRRRFLQRAAVAAAFAGDIAGASEQTATPGTAAGTGATAGAEARPASVVIRSAAGVRRVPDNFAGLSYELAQLSDPSFFSPQHHDLIALFRTLNPRGVLRLGGNTSEFCWFQAEPETPAPTLHIPPGDLAQNWMPHRLFAIQPEAIRALAGFLDAAGWTAIYGVNFGNSSPARAASEAAFVAKTLGDRLAFFQIGNEPDLYRNPSNGTRPPGWDFDDYLREWTAFADAISAAVPSARFAGPDTAASADWVVQFGRAMAPRLGSRLIALTGHYYAEGPPDDPTVTTARLLAGNQSVTQSTQAILAVADAHHLIYRMTEGNSCYRGGKPGMSDAFAAALWSADYLLLLANLGCAGVNLHGGQSRFLSAGLGDHNPGVDAAHGSKLSAPNGFYTPIASEPDQQTTARPVFYGMLLAQQFAGADMLTADVTASANVTAYAAQKQDRQLLAILNKDSTASLDFSVTSDRRVRHAEVWRLSGPSLEATSRVTLGSAAANPAGAWTGQAERLPVHNGKARIYVPAASGALVFLQ
jgi:hypothetical protein